MRLRSYHPGVTVDKICKKTGFPLDIAPDVHETLPPTAEEIRLLREEIDPLGMRELERMSGGRRRRKMREIIQSETKARLTLARGLNHRKQRAPSFTDNPSK